MNDRQTSSVKESDGISVLEERGTWIEELPSASAHKHCGQCGFSWMLHPWWFDSEDGHLVRRCSEYPVAPILALEACIGP